MKNKQPNEKNELNEKRLPDLAEFLPMVQSHAQIAKHITAILNHPQTPAILYNAIVDAIAEITSDSKEIFKFVDSAQFISYALAVYEQEKN